MRISDWSSDVCSSDLCDFGVDAAFGLVPTAPAARARVIARLDLRRARRAADRGVTFGLQRVARQVVRLEIGVEHLARPVGERVEFQPAGRTIELEARERSEEHTSELQSLMRISYAVFCLKKKRNDKIRHNPSIHKKNI